MNNFKQPTQIAHCKDCHKEFESKLVFGSWVKRCNTCKNPFVSATFVSKQLKNKVNYTSQTCSHNNQNAGGYCITCGIGRDFS